MSKKQKPAAQKKANRRARRRKHVSIAAIILMMALGFGAVVGPGRNLPGVRRISAFFRPPTPPPSIPAAGNPSKEYIYAGSKLIAVEEPPALLPPANLIAATVSGPQVSISWEATPGADHYQVERTTNIATAYTVIAGNVAATSFTDTTVTAVTAYLYRVRAVGASGNSSPYSNVDLATAISYTDDPLSAGSTLIKAQHITELRQAVDAVRATAGLSAAVWTDSSLSGVTIKAIHIQELRTNLDQALSALGLTLSSYTDPSLSGLTIKKVHLDELRERVK
jgi:chitodextrinase